MMLVSITEAARRLSALGDRIDRSTLSRYLAQHAEALPVVLADDRKSRLCNFDALLAHRRENIRIPTASAEPLRTGSPAGTGVINPRPGATQAEGAARKVNADAEMRELDLAERRGELVPRGEVDKSARDAVALMASAFEQALEASVAQATVRYGWDERQIRVVLKSHVKEGLGVFHRELIERLEALSPDRGALGVGAEI